MTTATSGTGSANVAIGNLASAAGDFAAAALLVLSAMAAAFALFLAREPKAAAPVPEATGNGNGGGEGGELSVAFDPAVLLFGGEEPGGPGPDDRDGLSARQWCAPVFCR